MSEAATTPAMAQYHAAKRQYPDALLFFRMGDFYELFYDDARQASKALGLTLTSRSKGEDAIPMAGVPVRSVDGYLRRLVVQGFRVALCDQVQDPKEAKGVVERRVVRVVTPGTLTEDSLLEGARANHLAAVHLHKGRAGVAWVELSTGAFWIDEFAAEQLQDVVGRIEPAELLLPDNATDLHDSLDKSTRAAITKRPAFEFGSSSARQTLLKFFAVSTLAGFDVESAPLGIGAAAALIGYLQSTQLAALPHVHKIARWRQDGTMLLDRATRQSLELVETMRSEQGGTPVLAVLDRTCTPMGARLTREWLLAPLTDLTSILQRQDAVAELFDSAGRSRLRERLASVLDLQRLTARIACGRCNARDLLGLRTSLSTLPEVKSELQTATCDALARLAKDFDPLTDVHDAIAAAIADDPPLTVREGGIIRNGYDAELDDLLALGRDSRDWIARYQQREVERTGIDNLRVSFNSVFGYYIEITHGNRAVELPKDYVRKQTTKNAERYITDELKTFETKALKAEQLGQDREYLLFCKLRDGVSAQSRRILATAGMVAEIDALQGLATVAIERGYHRPTVDDSRCLRIVDGRHPVIEATHACGTFIANDTDLDPPQRRLALITGPNMAGKSTFIRQNALIVILAQIGAFVPAKEAQIGVVDRVFTRVGSADDISRGASTFMVEMIETANILNHAGPRSLVILDEVGRGTSTYDGLSLAWAIAEDLHDRIGCRTLFATHYHQLVDLAEPGKGVVNLRVAVKEWGEEIVFLHRIENGATDRSYGLHVARLAGLPQGVVTRARTILDQLEQEGEVIQEALQSTPAERAKPKQRSLFEPPRERVLRELLSTDLDRVAPMDALQHLHAWAKLLRSEPS